MTLCEESKTGFPAGETCASCGHVNPVHRHGNSKQESCLLCQLELVIQEKGNR